MPKKEPGDWLSVVAMSGLGRPRPTPSNSNCHLFRRDPRIFFTGRIHEGVEQQILAAGLRYRHSGFNILHFGYLADGSVGRPSRIPTIGSRACPFSKLP
jgi:hypothetical protein